MADQYLGTPVIAFLVLTILTWAAVTVSGTTQELSTTTGDTVYIPCLFGDGTLSSIFWAYNDGTGRHKILSLANWDLTIEPEYASRASLQKDNSTLILKDITVADAGTYRCDVDRQGQTVVTNINTNLNVFSLRPDTLPVISPCTVADESSSCSIYVNQSFTLTSTLSNVYPVEDTELIWYQDRQRVSFTNDVNTQNDDGTTDISRQIQVSETGNFTCNATFVSANGRENTAISVVAWIIPPTDVPNTPGKNMTSGEIVSITICNVMIVLAFSLMMITLFLYHLKARGQRSSRKETNKSAGTQLCQVTSEEALMPLETSAEIGYKDGNARESPTEEPDIDDILMAIARKIQGDHVNHLGKELGFDKVEIERYVDRNSRYMNFTCAGTLAMLRDWDKKRFKARERAALKKALMDIGLVHLADNFLSEEGSDGNYTTMHTSSVTQGTNLKRMSSKADIDFDDILKEIAKTLYKNSDIYDLGKALGFYPADIDRKIHENAKHGGNYMGTLDLLRMWRNTQTPSTEKVALRSALSKSGFKNLADQFIHSTEDRMDRIVTESELDKLSRCLPADLYTTVAIKLGVGYGEHRYIKRQNTASFIDANFEMLMHWRHKEDGGKMRDLDKALEEAGCEGLLYKVDTPTSLPSSTVSQEASLNRMDRIVTESELCKLARCLPADLYTTVAIKLGVGYGEHRNIKKQNTASFIDANFEMLMHWRHEKDGGKVRDLDKALDEADCGGLSYKDM